MAQIKMLTGVVEVGLFCKMAKAAYFGNAVNHYFHTFLPGDADVHWVPRMVRSQFAGKTAKCKISHQQMPRSQTEVKRYQSEYTM